MAALDGAISSGSQAVIGWLKTYSQLLIDDDKKRSLEIIDKVAKGEPILDHQSRADAIHANNDTVKAKLQNAGMMGDADKAWVHWRDPNVPTRDEFNKDLIAVAAGRMTSGYSTNGANFAAFESEEHSYKLAVKEHTFIPVDRQEYADQARDRIAAKDVTIQARPATPGEEITTVMKDGHVETKNIAKPGDMVVTNPGGEQYIVSGEKFPKKYVPTDADGVFKPAGGPAKIELVDHNISFKAPWGEDMKIKAGGVLVNNGNGDIYGIQPDEYKQTYKLTDISMAKTATLPIVWDEVDRAWRRDGVIISDEEVAQRQQESKRFNDLLDKHENDRQIASEGRLTSAAQIGVAAYGLVQSGMGFYDAYKSGDKGGMLINGGNVLVSAVSVGQAATQASDGIAFLPNVSRTLTGANTALTVAAVGYQVYKEDGHLINDDGSLGHKGERLIAAAATTGASIGTGALLTSGFAAGAGGVAVTGAAAVVAPVAVSAAAVAVTAKATNMAIENRRQYEQIDKDVKENFKVGRQEVFGQERGQLSIGNYRNLPGVVSIVSKDMRDSQISGHMDRFDNGVFKQVGKFDLSDPRNMKEFERALDIETKKQQAIMAANDSILPRWVRSGDSVTKYTVAQGALEQLKSARQELDMYKQDLQKSRASAATPVERAVPAQPAQAQAQARSAGYDTVRDGGIKGGPPVKEEFQMAATGTARVPEMPKPAPTESRPSPATPSM